MIILTAGRIEPFVVLLVMALGLLASLLVGAFICLSSGSACNITGFETFCSFWNRCEGAPASSAIRGDQCLYARVVGLSPRTAVDAVELASPFRRVMFVQGPDAVVRAAGRHCTPEGRGRTLLNVGWTSPLVSGMFAYTVFVRPCASLELVPPNTTWTPFSAPITAAWNGVRVATEMAYGSSAADEVWDVMERDYSFAGGGLGPNGIVLHGNPFLAVCAFGNITSVGCCTTSTEVPAVYQALAAAFGHPAASPNTLGTVYTSPAVLRAFLSNSMGLNPFFNGDGRTFDGCTGYYSVVVNAEFLLPNKRGGNWANATDRIYVGDVTAANQGFSFVWGPLSHCNVSVTPCDDDDGTIVPRSECPLFHGTSTVCLLEAWSTCQGWSCP